jgi:hypothetical protein
MKHYKSERLKKLESELNDLEQWLKLGLVPKRDIIKHKEEIQAITSKIDEEKERLQFLRESGEAEEFIAPKRAQTRAGYTEMPTIPDIDAAETAVGSYHETEYQTETEHGEGGAAETVASEETGGDEEETALVEEDEESYFSDKNRWKRGGNIIDPDANEW